MAALALGAEGVAMGTRLMTTKESPLNNAYKKLSIEKEATETLFSDRFDGLFCRVMKTDAAKRAMSRGLDLPASFFNSREITRQLNVPFWKIFANVAASGWKNAKQMAFLANAFKAFRLATEDGDVKDGVLPIGQVTGMVLDGQDDEMGSGGINNFNDTRHHHHRWVPKPINLAGKNKPTMMVWKQISGMCQFV